MIVRLRLRLITALTLFAACLLAGCASGAPELTATAVYSRARSEIESQRATATVVRARMKTTLEYAGTRVGQAEEAGGLLRHSLSSLGTDTNFIETSASQIESGPTQIPPPTQIATRAPAANAITPISRPTNFPLAPTTVPTASPPAPADDRPRLDNIMMASGVNNVDCAIDYNPRFTPQSEAIYIVAEAHNIAAGASISSRWYRRGTEVAYFSFQADNDINGNCIWFFIDQTDTTFFPGSWSVEIRVDDVPLSNPIAFQVTEN